MEYDMKIWFQTGIWLNQGINIYLPDNHLGYPPLWAFWCLSSYRIYSLFGNNTEVWRFFIKLPMLLSQFILAFAMAKFAKKRFDEKITRKIFLSALTWIFFVYIGVLWGQLNMLSALLTFLAFYAVTSKRTLAGSGLLGIAVTLKIYPLIVLPVFLIFILKNRDKREAGKFGLITFALPIGFTFAVFAAYGWDILFFLKTIFYWTPVFDSTPIQMQGGGMNVWSFMNLLNVDITQISVLRFIWIPVLAAASFYWYRKPKMSEADFSLSLVSMYILFMITYVWIPEQAFLDPLPFIFLLIFGYQNKRGYLYALVVIQILVFAFSAFNWGPFIFEPLIERFSPSSSGVIQFLDPSKSAFVWLCREMLGLAVSLSLGIFLVALAKPSIFELVKDKICKKISQRLSQKSKCLGYPQSIVEE